MGKPVSNGQINYFLVYMLAFFITILWFCMGM